MPALPARARAAMRSLLSRPQPSSARMSTATATSCSDSSALSGRPGVPLMMPPWLGSFLAPCHPGPNHVATTTTARNGSRDRDEPEPGRPGGSRPRGALHVHLEATPVLAEPALLAGGADHRLPALVPVRVAALRLR